MNTYRVTVIRNFLVGGTNPSYSGLSLAEAVEVMASHSVYPYPVCLDLQMEKGTPKE